MASYPLEILDTYIRLQEHANDHQIRAVISFSAEIDAQRLCGAIRQTFASIPLLCCRYVPGPGGGCWDDHASYGDADLLTLTCAPEGEADLAALLADIPDQERGPQIRAHILRQPHGDTLVLIVNHMVCDGSGFRAYLSLLAQAYSGAPLPRYGNASRSVFAALCGIPLGVRVSALLRRSSSPRGERHALQAVGETTRLCLHRLTIAQMPQVRAFCRAHGLTVNDLVLALFAHALLGLAPRQPGERLTIQTMVDMRRYAGAGQLSPFGNFASMESIQAQPGASFLALASSIQAQTQALKAANPGLKNILLLGMLFHVLPLRLCSALLTRKISTFLLSTSNLGIIEDSQLRFGDVAVDDAYMLTSIKRQPALQLSFSTFRSTMTLSILGRYSAEKSARIERLLGTMRDLLEREIAGTHGARSTGSVWPHKHRESTSMDEKAQMIGALQEEFDRWDALLSPLNETQATTPLNEGGWSVKDIVAHLYAWQHVSIARLDAAVEHHAPNFPPAPPQFDLDTENDVNGINDWFHETYREWRWLEIYQSWRAEFMRYIDRASALSDEDLLDPARYPWMHGHPLAESLRGSHEHHHVDHFDEVRDWLSQHGGSVRTV